MVSQSKHEKHGADIPETPPVANDKPAIWELVISDMLKRDLMGAEKYGTRLQGFNGRDPLWDAYQEALDLVVYLRQAIYERDYKVDVCGPLTLLQINEGKDLK